MKKVRQLIVLLTPGLVARNGLGLLGPDIRLLRQFPFYLLHSLSGKSLLLLDVNGRSTLTFLYLNDEQMKGCFLYSSFHY